MSELNYKASNIARAEQALNANFFQTLEGLGEGTPSFTSLLMILRAGGLSEDEADTMLDEQGVAEALTQAVEALGKAGFLAKMKAEASQAEKEAPKNVETSPTTGNQTKA